MSKKVFKALKNELAQKEHNQKKYLFYMKVFLTSIVLTIIGCYFAPQFDKRKQVPWTKKDFEGVRFESDHV
jgi:hypothetical protein